MADGEVCKFHFIHARTQQLMVGYRIAHIKGGSGKDRSVFYLFVLYCMWIAESMFPLPSDR